VSASLLQMDQLQSLMSNLPKDHPIGMQFLRNGFAISPQTRAACASSLALNTQSALEITREGVLI